jgi:hypothetical protein
VTEAGDRLETQRKGKYAVRNRYPTTANKDRERTCAVSTVNCGVCNSVRLSQLLVVTFHKCLINPVLTWQHITASPKCIANAQGRTGVPTERNGVWKVEESLFFLICLPHNRE